MSAAPAWCEPYTGLPFKEKGRGPDGYDCYGLARRIRADLFGDRDMPDYVDAYASAFDAKSVEPAVASGLAEGGWERLEKPRPGCLVILLLGSHPFHCGVMVDERWMIHILSGCNSVLERIDSITWRNRLGGFYDRTSR